MKNSLKVLIPLFILFLLAACGTLQSEPTPTLTPQLPEKAEIVAAFFRASCENRTEEALSYLAEDVRLLSWGELCFSGQYARAVRKNMIEKSINHECIGENYRVDGDMVHFDYKKFSSDGNLVEEGSTSYSVSDGLIQWQAPCQPED